MEQSSVSRSMSSWVFCEQQYVELGLVWAANCRVGSSVSNNMSNWVFCGQQYVELGLLWAAIYRVGCSLGAFYRTNLTVAGSIFRANEILYQPCLWDFNSITITFWLWLQVKTKTKSYTHITVLNVPAIVPFPFPQCWGELRNFSVRI